MNAITKVAQLGNIDKRCIGQELFFSGQVCNLISVEPFQTWAFQIYFYFPYLVTILNMHLLRNFVDNLFLIVIIIIITPYFQ
jgi:hypothetical protein